MRLSRTRRRLARVAAALILLVSAFLKLFPAAAAGASFLEKTGFRIAAIAVEAILAVCIVLPRTGDAACRVALVFTGVIALFAAYLRVSGQPYCGCLGGWAQQAPWIHVIVIGLLGVLLVVSMPARDVALMQERGT